METRLSEAAPEPSMPSESERADLRRGGARTSEIDPDFLPEEIVPTLLPPSIFDRFSIFCERRGAISQNGNGVNISGVEVSMRNALLASSALTGKIPFSKALSVWLQSVMGNFSDACKSQLFPALREEMKAESMLVSDIVTFFQKKYRTFLEKREAKGGEFLCEPPRNVSETRPHPQGIIYRVDEKLFLNGRQIPVRGKYSEWWPSGNGIFLRRGNTIFSCDAEGAEKQVYTFTGSKPEIRESFGSLVIYERGEFIHITSDGIQRKVELGSCANWGAHPQGFYAVVGSQVLVNGQKPPVYSGNHEAMWSVPDGVVTRRGGEFYLNDEERPFLERTYMQCQTAPWGILLRMEDRLLMSDGKIVKTLYEGSNEGYHPTRDGVAVRRNKKWFLYRI